MPTADMNHEQTQTSQPTSSVDAPSNTAVHFVSALYWKKGGIRSEPVVLELAKDTLTMYGSDDRRVFQAPVSTAQVSFTRIGMLKLMINGESYALFINSGIYSRLSPALKTRLADSSLSSSDVALNLAGSAGLLAGVARSEITGNALPGMVGGLTGAAIHGAAAHKDDKLMDQWRASFQQAGIPTTGKSQQLLMGLVFGGIFFLFLMSLVLFSYLTQHK